MQLRSRALAGYLPPIRSGSVWESPLGSALKQKEKQRGGVVTVDGLLELPWNWGGAGAELGLVEDFKEKLIGKHRAPRELDLSVCRRNRRRCKTRGAS